MMSLVGRRKPNHSKPCRLGLFKTNLLAYPNAANEYRAVAQLVARLVWDQQVAGSSPVGPTIKKRVLTRFFMLLPKQAKSLACGRGGG